MYRNDTRYRAMNDHAEKSYKPLINFLDIVNNCPDDEFEAQIQTVMNVEFFFRFFFFLIFLLFLFLFLFFSLPLFPF